MSLKYMYMHNLILLGQETPHLKRSTNYSYKSYCCWCWCRCCCPLRIMNIIRISVVVLFVLMLILLLVILLYCFLSTTTIRDWCYVGRISQICWMHDQPIFKNAQSKFRNIFNAATPILPKTHFHLNHISMHAPISSSNDSSVSMPTILVW